MSNFKKVMLCILPVILLTSTVYGKKKADNDLLKIFISKENMNTFPTAELFVYRQLKKLSEPFDAVKEKKADIKLVPRIINYKREEVDWFVKRIMEDKRNGWESKLEFEISFGLILAVYDSDDRIIDEIRQNFNYIGIWEGFTNKSKTIYTKVLLHGNDEYKAINKAEKKMKKQFLQKVHKELVSNDKVMSYKKYLNLSKTTGTKNKNRINDPQITLSIYISTEGFLNYKPQYILKEENWPIKEETELNYIREAILALNGLFILGEENDCDIKIVPIVKELNVKKIGRHRIEKSTLTTGPSRFLCGDYKVTLSIIINFLDNRFSIIDSLAYSITSEGQGWSAYIARTKNIVENKVKLDAIEDAMKKININLSRNLISDIQRNKLLTNYANYLKEYKASEEKKRDNIVIWTGYQCKTNLKYSDDPFKSINKLTQIKINKFLLPRTPIDILSQIPLIINKPELPPLPILVKDQFETKAKFNERVKKAIDERESQIEKLQEQYRIDVEIRNQKIEELNNKYDKDIVSIKGEQNLKKEQLSAKVLEFNCLSFFKVMGDPVIENPVYDAETETMYVDFKASNANYQKRLSYNIPLSIAEYYYNNFQEVEPIAIYSINSSEIKLEQVKTKFKDNTYIATLTNEDFKPEIIEVALEDIKVDFDSEQQKKIKLQNPNLIDTYRVSAINYGESPEAKGLTYNDDITPIVEKLESKPEDPKKWLFIIGIEDYDETDPVIYSKNSAELFKDTAQKVFGIRERHTYALIEEEATSGSISDNLAILTGNVKDGDVIYFYYSGHGTPNEDGECYIWPKEKIYDFLFNNEELKLENIYKKLSDSKATKIFAFVDACNSGKTDDIPHAKGVAPGYRRTKKVEFNKNKMVVITAGSDKQFSNSFDEKGHRMFSYYLIKGLATRNDIDIDLLYKDISVKVHDTSFEKGDAYIQEPQIYGNKNLDLFNEEK